MFNFTKKLLMYSLMVCCTWLSLQSATASNVAEFASALAIIPAEIAANSCALKKQDPKKVVKLRILADLANVLNKSIFLCNSVGPILSQGRSLGPKNRESLFGGLLLARDLIKLGSHLKSLKAMHAVDAASSLEKMIKDLDDDGNDNDEFGENSESDDNEPANVEQPVIDSKEVSGFAKTWNIVLMPCLKGLSALALACVQENVSAYSSPQMRNLVSAARCFVALADELSEFDEANFPYKKAIYVALIINAVLFIYEINKYINPYELGYCTTCFGNGVLLIPLPCGHAFCKDCLVDAISAKVMAKDGGGHLINCLANGCETTLSSQMVHFCCADNAKIIEEYEEVLVLAEKMRKSAEADEASNLEYVRNYPGKNANLCPDCKRVVARDTGCAHVKCTCGTNFCVHCGVIEDLHNTAECPLREKYGIMTPNPLDETGFHSKTLSEIPDLAGYLRILGFKDIPGGLTAEEQFAMQLSQFKPFKNGDKVNMGVYDDHFTPEGV